MTDNDIKKLFEDFNPELPSDSLFIARLEKEMNTVEIIRNQNIAYKKIVRLAALISASVGFAVGLLLSLAVPYMSGLLKNFNINIPFVQNSYPIEINLQLLVWIAIGGLSVFAALSTYDLTIVRLRLKNFISSSGKDHL